MSVNGREFQPITTATVPASLRFDDFAQNYLRDIDPHYLGDIALAFEFAKGAHEGDFRDTGEPFFAHPLMCTIYAVETGFRKPSILVATLLHDVKEDNLRYLVAAERRMEQAINGTSPDDEYWQDNEDRDTTELIARQFGFGTAEILDAVTKTKGMKDKEHARRVGQGPSGAWVVKGEDRLHNLRTLGQNPDRVRRKIDETTELYLPVFKKAARTYPGPGERLLWLIEQELGSLEAGLKVPA